MIQTTTDDELRAAVFAFLDQQRFNYGERIPWKTLQSFSFEGRRMALITPRGIRWLSGMPALTYYTPYTPPGRTPPYLDREGPDGAPRYAYQGTDPGAPDNVAMLRAELAGKPLVWFIGTGEGVYDAIYPTYVIGHDERALEFTIALDEEQRHWLTDSEAQREPLTQRRYVERITRMRLHQPIFRSQLLRAYKRCAICRLGHHVLLDAAHIRPDRLGGLPVVRNGLLLCKIHHATYDADLLSVTPDYEIAVHPRLLDERDGPMLLHGIQATHGQPIGLPARRTEHPDRDALAERHEAFLARA